MFILFFAVVAFVFALEKDNETSKDDNSIVIITREGCGWSRRMREYLDDRNVPYKDRNTTFEGLGIKKKMGVEKATFPAVFFKGKYLGGYTDSLMNKEFKEYTDSFNEKSAHKDIKSNPKNLDLIKEII